MADLDEFFKERIKPYEERLKKLAEFDHKKDAEIAALKEAIKKMKEEIEKLKAQIEKNKSAAAAKGGKKPAGKK